MPYSATKIRIKFDKKKTFNRKPIKYLQNFIFQESVKLPDKIEEGKSTITGNFTPELAQELANILEVGKLPTSVHIIREWTENKSQIVAKQ